MSVTERNQKESWTPKQIVEQLDKHIVGQTEAKRSVAIALRNRYRRSLLTQEMRDEIVPKNILMMGPTGVGKTEIARRLAKLVGAPFVKLEATKFTEVGYVGRDVESMIRDLVEVGIRMVKGERLELVKERARQLANERIVELLVPEKKSDSGFKNPLEMFFSGNNQNEQPSQTNSTEKNHVLQKRRDIQAKLERGELEEQMIEIQVEEQMAPMLDMFAGAGGDQMGMNMQEMLGQFMPKKKKKRRLSVKEAREVLTQEEGQKLIDMDQVVQDALDRVEQSGIIFLDEIDKVAGKDQRGPDVSREGVQRDILPIVEGSTVQTKYGPVKTDYILFIAAGAFHVSKPSDLIPELQGRFPIRVELKDLTAEDFVCILTEPKNALIKQYTALLETENIRVSFTDEAIHEIAKLAQHVNSTTENIGARRLHTILERLLEELSFEAPDIYLEEISITPKYVQDRLGSIAEDRDLSQYIL
ncbi:ATP-dependent HslUV protease ATP-binding subunit HslU [Thermoactinomyces sp. DSM 45891]|uniref:ATP-dependent protease ATPase subunit HslU n=1 Tax=Thermoactinomyces sp. DSM 45891 TaxID=1761907 RepID=UPI000921663E|nr:ATP-dependent protease ATPase subunit HslU [Thermoactinomyces sp. DSM 45891]SFX35474.1 ATP-dependent HslUV protease ATP-binding subunit HslU [Thermoactinomyces sp. DSM 45891]